MFVQCSTLRERPAAEFRHDPAIAVVPEDAGDVLKGRDKGVPWVAQPV